MDSILFNDLQIHIMTPVELLERKFSPSLPFP